MCEFFSFFLALLTPRKESERGVQPRLVMPMYGCFENMDVLRAGSGEPARREGNAAMRKIEDIETLKAFVEDYERLKKIAKSLHRYYEVYCERSLTKREEKRSQGGTDMHS